jgi:hypothetical protein
MRFLMGQTRLAWQAVRQSNTSSTREYTVVRCSKS